ncbi:Mitogen-activated protein kinase 14-like protein [Aphelenchoides bicaudatus]|nr:Mitogen-activated protein kinase 14-like protein [Aphelenchoides bicaudatus]
MRPALSSVGSFEITVNKWANKESAPLRKCKIDGVSYFLPNTYEEETKCGECGQVRMLKAINKDTKQVVVITRVSLISLRTGKISADIAKSAYREFVLLGLVKHPNIINLIHAYTPNYAKGTLKELYLITPFVSNTLHNRLRSKEAFKDVEILNIIYKLLDGLDYLHKFKIVHRNLNPKSVGLNENGDPVIFDFGLTRLITKNATTNDAGIPVYMWHRKFY